MSTKKQLTRERATKYIRVRPSLADAIVSDAAEAMHARPTYDVALAWMYGEYQRLKEGRRD